MSFTSTNVAWCGIGQEELSRKDTSTLCTFIRLCSVYSLAVWGGFGGWSANSLVFGNR